ncbi:MAG: hypothetical protein EOO20_10770 [Chryseobacterium sp.]|nr:MAG: hypothetical protein EOO20_10770 [Chryseobacterium sp.]
MQFQKFTTLFAIPLCTPLKKSKLGTAKHIRDYISNPFPLWNQEIADLVIGRKWDSSLKNIFQDPDHYSIVGCIVKDVHKEKTIPLAGVNYGIQIACPSENLSDFYYKHGLVPADINISFAEKSIKINNAINILGKIKPLQFFVFQIVRSIQLLEPENVETDISYSHPEIPFSIFLSVCEDDSIISDLRVAESIVHESMHLLLTLIEDQIDLIVPYTKETFYSPWRDEQRPVRGVLHGLFVFKAIKDFYRLLLEQDCLEDQHDQDYLISRLGQIEIEIKLLSNFSRSSGLTYSGKLLCDNLIVN